jgi:regulator of extracellular matrix RemA (YlzA/DUF370 family)
MKRTALNVVGLLALAGIVVMIGCAHRGTPETADMEKMLREKDQQIEELAASNEEKDEMIEEYQMKLDESSQAGGETEMRREVRASQAGDELFPPMAKPGECYTRVFVPPVYKTVTEDVLKHGESERLEVIPAQYEWVEERVTVREEAERLEVVPAQYDWVEERVLVSAASTRLEQVPARYEWKEERVLAKEAHTVWKKGRGPIERVDNSTGEIMCLVEVPASYNIVKKKVMVSPPSTREIEIPAEYQTVKKQVMVKPPSQRTIKIPAEYKTVKVRKLVSEAKERRVPIPAEYQTVTRTEMVTDGHMAWREILCETNATPQTISRIQRALKEAGYNPGPIDGNYGAQTAAAVTAYQRDHGLATGGLTYKTIEKLGVKM